MRNVSLAKNKAHVYLTSSCSASKHVTWGKHEPCRQLLATRHQKHGDTLLVIRSNVRKHTSCDTTLAAALIAPASRKRQRRLKKGIRSEHTIDLLVAVSQGIKEYAGVYDLNINEADFTLLELREYFFT